VLSESFAAAEAGLAEQAGGYPIVDRLIDFRLWIGLGQIGWRFATLPTVVGEHFI
jgi:hypothetical protein